MNFTSLQNSMLADTYLLEKSAENIAKSSIPGYKGERVEFSSVFASYLNSHSGISRGSGIRVSNVYLDMSAGNKMSGTSLDLAIDSSNAFFVVSNGTENTFANNQYAYTRNGKFKRGNNNNLTTTNGDLVYGYKIEGGFRSSILEPIKLLDDLDYEYSWDSDGRLVATRQGETTGTDLYQIALTSFSNSSGLLIDGSNYIEGPNSGTRYAFTPAGSTLGTVSPGYYESSNIDPVEETLKYITPTQRYLEYKMSAYQAMLSVLDKFLQTVVG